MSNENKVFISWSFREKSEKILTRLLAATVVCQSSRKYDDAVLAYEDVRLLMLCHIGEHVVSPELCTADWHGKVVGAIESFESVLPSIEGTPEQLFELRGFWGNVRLMIARLKDLTSESGNSEVILHLTESMRRQVEAIRSDAEHRANVFVQEFLNEAESSGLKVDQKDNRAKELLTDLRRLLTPRFYAVPE